MPTIGPSPAADPDLPHRHRELAESFGLDARRYDRTRPGYPAAMVDALLSAMPGRRVLDVGIGTGLSARPFRDAGCTVLGVEVDPRMAAVAVEHGFVVETSSFEDWPAAGRTFDAVLAGQTWHWIDPVAGARRAAEVLVPGGRFAAFWNIGEPDPAVAAAFADVYRSVDTGLPFTPWAAPATAGYSTILDKAAGGLRAVGAFGEPEQWRFAWSAAVTTAEWLDQVPTAGGHQRLPADTLHALLDRMAAVVDGAGGRFTMNYATVALTSARR